MSQKIKVPSHALLIVRVTRQGGFPPIHRDIVPYHTASEPTRCRHDTFLFVPDYYCHTPPQGPRNNPPLPPSFVPLRTTPDYVQLSSTPACASRPPFPKTNRTPPGLTRHEAATKSPQNKMSQTSNKRRDYFPPLFLDGCREALVALQNAVAVSSFFQPSSYHNTIYSMGPAYCRVNTTIHSTKKRPFQPPKPQTSHSSVALPHPHFNPTAEKSFQNLPVIKKITRILKRIRPFHE